MPRCRDLAISVVTTTDRQIDRQTDKPITPAHARGVINGIAICMLLYLVKDVREEHCMELTGFSLCAKSYFNCLQSVLLTPSLETHPIVLPVASAVARLGMHHPTAVSVLLITTSIQMDHVCHVSYKRLDFVVKHYDTL